MTHSTAMPAPSVDALPASAGGSTAGRPRPGAVDPGSDPRSDAVAAGVWSGLIAGATGLVAWSGGGWLACLLGALLGGGWIAWRTKRRCAGTPSQEPPGHAPLVEQVVPVWQRQIDAAREHAEHSTGEILAAFTMIDQRLEEAVRLAEQSSMDLSGSTVDALIDDNDAVLANLLEPIRSAVAQRDAALAEIERVGVAIDEVRQGAARVRQLARRINMVAINASVESARAGGRAGSFAVLAEEVRQLAQQATTDASQMLQRSNRLEEQLRSLRLQAATRDSSDEELRAQADAGARRAIGGLLDSVGQVSRSSRGLREAGAAVRGEVERVLMGFQAQDRLNQMLGSVTEDMSRLGQWLQQQGDLSSNQAAEWLARLEAAYTMEEQRSQHHGQQVIERRTEVEFF